MREGVSGGGKKEELDQLEVEVVGIEFSLMTDGFLNELEDLRELHFLRGVNSDQDQVEPIGLFSNLEELFERTSVAQGKR